MKTFPWMDLNHSVHDMLTNGPYWPPEVISGVLERRDMHTSQVGVCAAVMEWLKNGWSSLALWVTVSLLSVLSIQALQCYSPLFTRCSQTFPTLPVTLMLSVATHLFVLPSSAGTSSFFWICQWLVCFWACSALWCLSPVSQSAANEVDSGVNSPHFQGW